VLPDIWGFTRTSKNRNGMVVELDTYVPEGIIAFTKRSNYYNEGDKVIENGTML